MTQKLLSKKSFTKVALAVLAGGLVLWFIVWATSPHQGRVNVNSTRSSNSVSTSTKTLDGTYVSFEYSSKYMVRNEGPQNNDLEIHTLNADTHYDKQIIVIVSNLPDGQVESYSAYTYRKLNTDLYSTRKVTVAGTQTDMMVKKDGTEQTVFVPRGTKVATISFATASANDRLNSEVDTLLKSFRWKE